MDPTFLTLDEVIEIHRDMIERYGGSTGIRDEGLLESAVVLPQTGLVSGICIRDGCGLPVPYRQKPPVR